MGLRYGHLLLALRDHLTLLGELFDGVDVGLLCDLSLHLLYVVQVERGGGRCQARGGFVGDGGQRGHGGHGGQRAHVCEGSRHGGSCHTGHRSTHGHVRHVGHPWHPHGHVGHIGHVWHVGHIGHTHGQVERQG